MLHEMLARSFGVSEAHDALFVDRNIIFGDYLRMGATGEDRMYEEVVSTEKLGTLLEDYLDEYNLAHSSTVKLVFFMDAISHISRLARVLRQPRGNMLLVGVGGSGKQSLTRFACFMAEYQCFQIELSRAYGMNEFHEDLKKLYKIAGVQGSPVTFLFTDTQIVNEGFVEDINNLLNTGEVPGLFPPDERERIIHEIRPYCEERNLPQTRDSMYATFISRVRENLHVESIAKMCVQIHTSVTAASEKFFQELRRRFYTTPKSYLDLISLYVTLLQSKREELTQARDRLLNGLRKLRETEHMVDSMRVELNELQPVLKEKTEITKQLLVQVTADQEEAVKVRDVVLTEEAEVQKSAAQTQAIWDDAEADLAEAMPAMNSAIEALNALNKGDITEIKSFPKPPVMVQKTMEAVCTLLSEKADWDTAKKVLSDVQLIKKLTEFDKDGMTDKIMKGIRKYIDDPTFTPDQVAKQSNAAKSLCLWVHAMDKYARVSKIVAPKKAALKQAQEMLDQSKAMLKSKKEQLAEVDAQVAALRTQLTDAEAEEKSLQEQAEMTRKRLIRAGKLTTGLADEEVRWAQTAQEIQEAMGLLVGDVFLSAASISYYGPFTGPYRDELVELWCTACKKMDIPVSDKFDLRETLSKAVEVREWNIWGLPTDDVSIDNGILVTRGRRWPLMIDPQGQANKWVKAMEVKNGARVTKLTDPNLLRTLENSIRIGNPVLLEDVDEHLDPALEPILQKQILKQGNRMLMRLGDSDVDYDPGFKLYITTKLPNPHYLPEVCIKVTIINFTVTMKGLEDQLLGDLVRKERPDLEENKDRLVINISSDKKQLKDLEDKILKLLKESEGNILDDELLINTLNNSKLTSSVITVRVKEAEETEKEINANRELFRSVPVRGSILYFVLADLSLIDPMYQFSLSYFVMLFNKCIDLSEPSEVLEERLDILLTFTTEYVYRNVCRSLFEQHKMIFSFLITSSIHRATGRIAPAEWNFLMRGAGALTDVQNLPGSDRNCPPFIPLERWGTVRSLASGVPTMSEIAMSILERPLDWSSYAASAEPYAFTHYPEGCPKPSPFHKLLLVKTLKEDMLGTALCHFVREMMGDRFVENPPFSLDDIYKDTSKVTPIIFILSTGADPTGMLQRFGSKMKREPGERLHIISLGQGQGPIAEATVQKGLKAGDWVCLQNCHLASSWMMTLEKLVESLQTNAENHEDFRLWLTSMPSADFPVPVLQIGIKVTNEPPKGVRANLLRTFADMTDEYLESCSKPRAWKKLLFACSFFHAILQERRKFGPLGWNIRYDFSNSDLECSLKTLKMFLEENDHIPWPALVYVTGQINYGGRVTDDLDRRCLMSILSKFYTPEVMEDSYTFSASGLYRAPGDSALAGYLEYIRQLPGEETPEVFGMHANANITFQLQETQKIIETVLSIQPRLAAAEGGKSSDDIVTEVASDIKEALPDSLERNDAGPSTFEVESNGHITSLGIVLMQEMDRLNRLLRSLQVSLTSLLRAIQGLVVMSADLEVMFTCLLNNQVPGMWTRVAYPSLKPLSSWVADFHQRYDFLRGWLKVGQPKCYWLPGLFFPQGFLTGALQTHARKYKIPIDTLNFTFALLDIEDPEDIKERPQDGVYINGLFLDGAQWDHKTKCMREAESSVMFSKLPIILFLPTQDAEPPTSEYQCPLYKTAVRAGVLSTTGQSTNYVLSISLPLPKSGPSSEPTFWVLQGIAALCALS
ncbi:hypothetical protein CYMTET_46533 [Cymbomonas tetramitiformis]|uniref:Uncharacterized protein n=1 Tax=Cymbomonas tetramitiformis TaxID=36881 RepID=A0AAE0EX71_9CHLO|nr:hypothetical protein CYMTET_46533 [Cymbomonas tetramitiformis]